MLVLQVVMRIYQDVPEDYALAASYILKQVRSPGALGVTDEQQSSRFREC
jgi:hypothetical protein